VFDELNNYKNKGSFSFKRDKKLEKVCNAPTKSSGIYIVYSMAESKDKPIYIGSSGKMQKDGKIRHRKNGLYGRIVNGKQFDKSRRKLSWPKKMKEQQIDELNIYWYVTFDDENTDIPAYVEAVSIQKYYNKFRSLPDWNKAF